jgi:hypothetical protein
VSGGGVAGGRGRGVGGIPAVWGCWRQNELTVTVSPATFSAFSIFHSVRFALITLIPSTWARIVIVSISTM